MRRLLSIAFLTAMCAAAVVLAAAGGGGGSATGKTYHIVFDNAFGLVEGGDFRVGGVKAGSTESFGVTKTKDGAPKGVVTVKVTEPGLQDFRSDASCDIKPQSLIGEYFVDCQPGNSPVHLKNNATIPVSQTTSTVPQDLINDVLRAPAKDRLRLIITELGTGLAGRPGDLQAVIHRAAPGLRETSKVLRILGDQNRTIENFIRDSDTVVAQLARNRRDVARFVTTAGNASAAAASRRGALQETFHRLPGFLDQLRPTMASLGRVADQQIPLLADVQRAAPDLTTFITRLRPFAKVSRPALKALGGASTVGTRAFAHGSESVRVLSQLAKDAPGTAKPLRQFLQAMDERNHAVDEDPRAKVNGPPPSDPSYGGGRGGFTGFEAIANYPFWQTLSLNGFDNIGHVLRIAITATKCSMYVNQRETPGNTQYFKDCNQWLGPYQPGVNAPDPTASTAAAAKLRAANDRPPANPGEVRGPGQPEAGPLPGQPDISKPQIVLPPGLQQLVGRLPGSTLLDALQGAVPSAGGASSTAPTGSSATPNAAPDGATQLLEYLFGS